MPSFLVAIVGRPNVGKSTLVNRLASSQQAIVHKTPGVTRDRNYLSASWRGVDFILIDTGGLEISPSLPVSRIVCQQAMAAVKEADLVIFLVDAKTGVLGDDYQVSEILRREDKPVLLVVNKIDSLAKEDLKYSFYELGLGDPITVSAAHGLGIGDLLDKVVAMLPEKEQKPEPTGEKMAVAIVGRPNVGKSSILNRLVGYQRAIVSQKPGTTRDAIDTILEEQGVTYRFIDTAGLRKIGRLSGQIEYYGVIRSIKAIEQSDIALLVIDAFEGITRQDQKIAQLIEEKGCGVVVLLNKWDLIVGKSTNQSVAHDLETRLGFINYALVLKLSALTGKGVEKIFPAINKAYQSYSLKLSTSKLNQFVTDLKTGWLPVKRGKKLHLKYATQLKTAPPRFLIFVNKPQMVDNSYQRYVENQFRKRFDFQGTPVFFYYRQTK